MAAVEEGDVVKDETMQIDTFTQKAKVKNEKKELMEYEMAQNHTVKT